MFYILTNCGVINDLSYDEAVITNGILVYTMTFDATLEYVLMVDATTGEVISFNEDLEEW